LQKTELAKDLKKKKGAEHDMTEENSLQLKWYQHFKKKMHVVAKCYVPTPCDPAEKGQLDN